MNQSHSIIKKLKETNKRNKKTNCINFKTTLRK